MLSTVTERSANQKEFDSMSLIPRHPSLLPEDSKEPSHPALLSIGLVRADPQPHYETKHCYGRPNADHVVADDEDDGFELVLTCRGAWQFYFKLEIAATRFKIFDARIVLQDDGNFLLTVIADGHQDQMTYWRFDDLRDRMRAAFGMWRTNTMAKVAT